MPKILMHRKHNNVNAASGMLPTEAYLWPFIHNIFKPILLKLNFGLEEIKFQESPTQVPLQFNNNNGCHSPH
jgi:hypothetical protein